MPCPHPSVCLGLLVQLSLWLPPWMLLSTRVCVCDVLCTGGSPPPPGFREHSVLLLLYQLRLA